MALTFLIAERSCPHCHRPKSNHHGDRCPAMTENIRPDRVRDYLEAMLDAADEVYRNWESGDLAGAVNDLLYVSEEARNWLEDI